MRILILLAAALTLQAQPLYDLLLKGGHVIDPNQPGHGRRWRLSGRDTRKWPENTLTAKNEGSCTAS